MKIFAILTTKYENHTIVEYVGICPCELRIAHKTTIEQFDEEGAWGKYLEQYVQVEGNKQFKTFECSNDNFTEEGQKAFTKFYSEQIIPSMPSW